jgi:hypothetical protein
MRRELFSLHLHPHPFTIRAQLNPAISIRAQQGIITDRLQLSALPQVQQLAGFSSMDRGNSLTEGAHQN